MKAVFSQIVSSEAREPDAPNFDKLARAYRWMEYLSFGPLLWHCRCEYLSRLGHCRKALVIGDGDGRYAAQLLEANPFVHVDAVDASPAMLKALLRRAGKNAKRVHVDSIDARAWHPSSSEPYDLVVTHFFLDCLNTSEVRSLASKIRHAVTPDAMWIVSEFSVPSSLFGQLIARPLVAVLYLAFGLLTGLKVRSLPDHTKALSLSGFSMSTNRLRAIGLLASELWTISRNHEVLVHQPINGK